jgi:cytochrome b involved in lipid metabolism
MTWNAALGKRIAAVSVIALMTAPLTAPAYAATPAKTYTASQVKKHNKPADCWSIVNGRVYNLTGYISRHPGGSARIIGMCGKDGSSAYSGQHRGSAAASASLKPYKIGTLA